MDSRSESKPRDKVHKHSSSSHKHKKRKRDRSYSSSSDSYSSDSSSASSSSSDDRKHRRKHKSSSKSSRKRSPIGGRIDEDDFYKKSAEFKQWLREKQGIAFEELDAREARDIFADDFCYLWNRNKLPEHYYEGHVAAQKSKHAWAFKDVDSNHLASIKNQVQVQTNAGRRPSSSSSQAYRAPPPAPAGPAKPLSGKALFEAMQREGVVAESGGSLKNDILRFNDHDEYKQRHHEDKKYKKRRQSDMDDMVPKETGRDAKLDKNRAYNQTRRERESDRGGEVVINPYDDSGDPIKARMFRQEQERAKVQASRDQERSVKLKEYQEKESQSMEMFKELARQSGYNV